MINQWNDRSNCRNHRLDIRLRRAKLKLNRWWIYYRYNGDPNNDPFLLTSRPKNIPLISLRTDEYGGFLKNKEYVGKQWKELYDYAEFNGNKKFERQVNNGNERIPLKQLIGPVSNNEIYKQKLNNNNTSSKKSDIKIYQDMNNQISKTLKKKKRKNTKEFNFLKFEEDNNSLESFERELLESANLTFTKAKMLFPFGENKQTPHELKTPDFEDYDKVEVKSNKDKSVKISNFDDLMKTLRQNDKIFVVESAGLDLDNINLDKEFDHNSFHDNYNNNNYNYDLANAINNKPNYQALGFDGDRIAVHKKMKSNGIKGWISNNLRPESKSTFNNKLTLNSNPIYNYNIPIKKFSKLPLIQRPEFFDRNQLVSRDSNYCSNIPNKQEFSGINELREYQVKNYVRPNKIKREIRKEHNKRPISRSRLSTRDESVDNLILVIDKLRNNFKNKVYEELTNVMPKSVNNNHEEKKVQETNMHKWRLFNGYKILSRRDKKALVNDEKANAATVGGLKKLETNSKRRNISKKEVTIISPVNVIEYDNFEQHGEEEGEENEDSFEIYNLIASYEEEVTT